MTGDELILRTARQLEICNACRYCEGYCAVFPALERRTSYGPDDVHYIANLCHDCRDCLYACPFAPPHEFGINLPATLAEVRADTYRRYARPRALGWLEGWQWARVTRACALSVIAMASVALVVSGAPAVVAQHEGPGSFYDVVPWLLMLVPALLGTAYVLLGWVLSGYAFWTATEATASRPSGPAVVGRALVDVLTLRYLRGGGQGCAYPTERPSFQRWSLHSLVFYGFALCFASTCAAAVEQDVLGILPPYPLLSAPVILGTVGGVAMVAGAAGLLVLKGRSNPDASSRWMTQADYAFIGLLGVASLTGLLTLVLRDSRLLGPALIVHLGVLAALYVTAPYSKFIHFVYRLLALLRNRSEEAWERASGTVRDASA